MALLSTTVTLGAAVGCGATETVVVDHGTVTEKSGPASQWVPATSDKYGRVCRQVPVQKAAWTTQFHGSVPLKPGPKPAPKKPAAPNKESEADAPKQPKGPDLTKPTSRPTARSSGAPDTPQGSTKEVCGNEVVRKGTPGHWTENQRVLKLKDKKGNATRWRVSEPLWQQAKLDKFLDLRKTAGEYHQV
ncbi:hypothetical protein ACFYMW_25585 [Streptomyces sp. NPDC006692]|uniref:hypothetical protein n=1 Tax=unclassified Streptomyces TaxID=2593676 RepID=UPI0034467C13